ncbi:hypothetical protein RVBP17_2520 [Pseudomonas phage sp. 30-3]|uniref:Uncharacterized protein n=1 Tax=Pseudomonas phage vB_PaeM_PA5oct TaxID=2163605 RepID=A0A4Y1LV06_9CAUD|nr:hypothetical protein PQE65_gp142 [Pseudomonas phage vB_PaeM_PA5oct]WMI31886.1 hypothetical protein GBBBJNDB_00183 [Pseudomonas phage Callisto]WPK38818.1 hypothetical protein Cassandra_0142 [Pseudomonas phage Cassandra]WPK39339.1 hypothetical protein Deiofobo_0142 [Pseudomonas phage Deifobo]WPK39851.1 hypothetical protein ETTORE_0142 [Pseudomonas phage Ettore]WPK40372.1 hypothetical protein Paride_0142 [Pseudomonas phage Paride]VOH54703.1 hypothetical protein MIJ3_00183 [Pseudomonas phage v
MAKIYLKKLPEQEGISFDIEEFLPSISLDDLHLSYVDYVEVICENGSVNKFDRQFIGNLIKSKKDERLSKLGKIEAIFIYLDMIKLESEYQEAYHNMLCTIHAKIE